VAGKPVADRAIPSPKLSALSEPAADVKPARDSKRNKTGAHPENFIANLLAFALAE